MQFVSKCSVFQMLRQNSLLFFWSFPFKKNNQNLPRIDDSTVALETVV